MRLRGFAAAPIALSALAAAARAAPPPLRLDPIASVSGLATHVAHAGDERLFIAERGGRIRIWKPGVGLLAAPFLDLTALVDTSGDGALAGLAFHPGSAGNGHLFVSYTEAGSGAVPMRSVIARYAVSASDPDRADPASAALLLRVDEPATSHNVGALAFAPDGTLFASFGDGGRGASPPGHACRSQLDSAALGTDALHGKVLRLDVDAAAGTPPYYAIPADNPFADPGDGIADEIFAKGFRNPWRISLDRETGDLWIGDVGQDDREELIRIPGGSGGGQNHGWPVMEGSLCFDPDPLSPECPAGTPSCFDPALSPPVFEYETGIRCSVTGGSVYRGREIAPLRGRYVFGDLCTGEIFALAETQPGVFASELLLQPGGPLTSFGEDVDGELLVVSGSGVSRLRYDGEPALVPALGSAALAGLAAALALAALVWLRQLPRGSRGGTQ